MIWKCVYNFCLKLKTKRVAEYIACCLYLCCYQRPYLSAFSNSCRNNLTSSTISNNVSFSKGSFAACYSTQFIKSLKRIKEKCKPITRSSDPASQEWKLKKLEVVMPGWENYFKIAKAKTSFQRLTK